MVYHEGNGGEEYRLQDAKFMLETFLEATYQHERILDDLNIIFTSLKYNPDLIHFNSFDSGYAVGIIGSEFHLGDLWVQGNLLVPFQSGDYSGDMLPSEKFVRDFRAVPERYIENASLEYNVGYASDKFPGGNQDYVDVWATITLDVPKQWDGGPRWVLGSEVNIETSYDFELPKATIATLVELLADRIAIK